MIQLFENNVKITRPVKDWTINDMFNYIKNMPPDDFNKYEKIRQAEIDGDAATKAFYKQQLYYVVPAVYLNPEGHRSYEDIIEFNGVMPLDYDHLESPDVFKKYLFEKHKEIIAAWLSSSGKGVRALVKIPTVYSVDDYKSLFWGATETFGKYDGFDIALQNCVLPLFLSPDKDILIRNDFDEWTTTGENPKELAYDESSNVFIGEVKRQDKTSKIVLKRIWKAIDKIEDNGHPQLRAAAFTLGGYVGGGFINRDYAIEQIHLMIESNAYLSQKPAVYKKTAVDMIISGMKKPIVKLY